MSAPVAVVADDLTGAADAAAGFLRATRNVLLTWPSPSIDLRFVREIDVGSVELPLSVLESADAAERNGFADRIVQALRADDLLVSLPLRVDEMEDSKFARRLAELLAPCGDVAKALAITGGETATQVLAVWGISGLTLFDEVEPRVLWHCLRYCRHRGRGRAKPARSAPPGGAFGRLASTPTQS